MERLTVPGDLDSLGAIRGFVRTAAVAAGLDKTATYRLCLAVDEIATNIITHGYKEAGLKGGITVWNEIVDNTLKIHIEDTGARYDVAQYADPENLHRPFAQRTEGGLGVYLAIQGVDGFTYESDGGTNRHTFVVNLTGSLTGPTEPGR